ncbi:MAG: hypothetical protein AMXMBFR52_25890 [Burkholderiales bacterium]|jgi:LysR family pca operon transcriptional activator|nr:pca operon transcription factor PcaQ [Burkholderiaceae bacterium]
MHPGRIKLRHLQTLVAVAQHRNLTRAAHALAVTQPAVSKTLRELDELLGCRVLERSPHGISLTAQGELLVRHAGAALRVLREGLDAVGAMEAEAPPVVAVGMLPTAAPSIFPRAVVRYRESCPRGRLKIVTRVYTELLKELKRGELDLVLGRQAEPAEMTGLAFEPLYSEPLVLAVRPGHSLLRVRKARLSRALSGSTLLLPNEGTVIRHAADVFLLGQGIEVSDASVECLSTSFGRAYTRSTDTVWFVPLGMVEADLRSGSLVRLAIDTEATRAAVGLTVQAGVALRPAVEAMMRSIRAVAAGAVRRPAGQRAMHAA